MLWRQADKVAAANFLFNWCAEAFCLCIQCLHETRFQLTGVWVQVRIRWFRKNRNSRINFSAYTSSGSLRLVLNGEQQFA